MVHTPLQLPGPAPLAGLDNWRSKRFGGLRLPWVGTRAMPLTLLERVAAGDVAAVQQCIDRYGGLIWSLARRLVPRQADAEDAVQEVFIALWKSAGRFDPSVAGESTFVAMIARRRLIDRQRRLARRVDGVKSIALEDVDVASEVSNQNGVDARDEAARAADAVTQLRPEQQEVLRLAVYDGWSHQRIADHLQMPLGTVKTHVRRGLIRVRELLTSPGAAAGKEATS
jgi:RNA polymerase sigma factor (sigma-70 family)